MFEISQAANPGKLREQWTTAESVSGGFRRSPGPTQPPPALFSSPSFSAHHAFVLELRLQLVVVFVVSRSPKEPAGRFANNRHGLGCTVYCIGSYMSYVRTVPGDNSTG
ncbi:hypothetical protein RB195_002874 [Necator americanus]|uniref:Uncharacterized protein n=1 Tax=Necator americanus TaxID=51031 RepID=A0ABR1DLX8_NECAM